MNLQEQQAKAWRLAKGAVGVYQDAHGHWYKIVHVICGWGFKTKHLFLFKSEINNWNWQDTLQSREEFEAMNNKSGFDEVITFSDKDIPNEDLANSRGFAGDKKWMPEVGQKAKMRFIETYDRGDNQWSRFFEITMLYKSEAGIEVEEPQGNGTTRTMYSLDDYAVEFEPLQTEADKKRDEQIQKLSVALLMKQLVTADDLYDYGCRAIAPDEYVVKRLSDEQVDKLVGKWNGRYRAELIESVQRELGITP